VISRYPLMAWCTLIGGQGRESGHWAEQEGGGEPAGERPVNEETPTSLLLAFLRMLLVSGCVSKMDVVNLDKRHPGRRAAEV